MYTNTNSYVVDDLRLWLIKLRKRSTIGGINKLYVKSGCWGYMGGWYTVTSDLTYNYLKLVYTETSPSTQYYYFCVIVINLRSTLPLYLELKDVIQTFSSKKKASIYEPILIQWGPRYCTESEVTF